MLPEVPAQLAETLLASPPGTPNNAPLSWTLTLLLFALTILLETCGTACMKLSQRSSNWWQLGTFVFYVLSFSVFPLVLRRIPLSLAYAAWSGIGTSLVVLLGVICFGEELSFAKVRSALPRLTALHQTACPCTRSSLHMPQPALSVPPRVP